MEFLGDLRRMSFQGYGDRDLRIAMLGMVEGNGHPYSWSAIFNGYDPVEMARCPYPVIPDYLNRQPRRSIGIPGARVTHVWTDHPDDAANVARASLIPSVAARPDDVIGHVDAVIVATDIGSEHVDRCRPFLDAGLPIFVDKPLVDTEEDLRIFRRWHEEGRPFMSSSCMAYATEFRRYRDSTGELGAVRYATATTMKSWERYGIHALSIVYPILGAGFVSAQHCGARERAIAHFTHRNGADVVIAAIDDMLGGFGKLLLCGTKSSAFASFGDTYSAFRAQLLDFVTYLRTGVSPVRFEETDELMTMLIAAVRSREEGGREVMLAEIAQ